MFHEIDFPVSLQPVTVQGRVSPQYQAIVREDTGQVLGVHGNAYRLVTNREIFTAFDTALAASCLDLTGMIVTPKISHAGARTVCTYRFPAYKMDVGQGDWVDLQLRVMNSYDGRWAFSMLVGAFRWVCANGLVVGEKFAHTYGRHTPGIDIDATILTLRQVLHLYQQRLTEWRRWTGQGITDEVARQVFLTLPGINERLLGQLHGYWQQEKTAIGPTVWSLYNAMTGWSTHAPVRKASQANAAALLLDREQRVRHLLTSPVFRSLTA